MYSSEVHPKQIGFHSHAQSPLQIFFFLRFFIIRDWLIRFGGPTSTVQEIKDNGLL